MSLKPDMSSKMSVSPTRCSARHSYGRSACPCRLLLAGKDEDEDEDDEDDDEDEDDEDDEGDGEEEEEDDEEEEDSGFEPDEEALKGIMKSAGIDLHRTLGFLAGASEDLLNLLRDLDDYDGQDVSFVNSGNNGGGGGGEMDARVDYAAQDLDR